MPAGCKKTRFAFFYTPFCAGPQENGEGMILRAPVSSCGSLLHGADGKNAALQLRYAPLSAHCAAGAGENSSGRVFRQRSEQNRFEGRRKSVFYAPAAPLGSVFARSRSENAEKCRLARQSFYLAAVGAEMTRFSTVPGVRNRRRRCPPDRGIRRSAAAPAFFIFGSRRADFPPKTVEEGTGRVP